jgi:exosortase
LIARRHRAVAFRSRLQGRVVSLLPYLLVGLAHLPLLVVYFQQLWGRPHYQFFPLVLGAAAYFLWQRWPHRSAPSTRGLLASGGLLLVSLPMLGCAFLWLSPMLAYASLLLVLASALLRLGVPALGPWLLLWMLVRIPYGQDVALIQWMQRLTTDLSSTALDRLRIEHIADGNVLLFPGTSLFVEEACSGVVSLLAIVACGGILAVWWRRSIVHAACLIGSAVFLAGAMNVVRVITIALALEKAGVDLSTGWQHETLGLVIFAVSLVGLFSLDRLLSFFLGPIGMNPLSSYWDDAAYNGLIRFWNHFVGLEPYDEEDVWHSEHPDSESPATPATHRLEWLGRAWDWGIAALFLLVGGGQVLAGIGPFSVAPEISPIALDLSEDALPASLGAWQQAGFETLERDSSSAFGEYSRIWAYHNGTTTVRVSVDFVFPEWHALEACYAGIGWQRTGSRTHNPADAAGFVEATFTRPDGQRALLLFDLFDENGLPYQAPEGSFVHPQLRRIFSGEATRWTLPNYYQVQALALSEVGEIPEPQREQIRELFVHFRREMAQQIGGAEAARPPGGGAADGSRASKPLPGKQPQTQGPVDPVPAAERPADQRAAVRLSPPAATATVRIAKEQAR